MTFSFESIVFQHYFFAMFGTLFSAILKLSTNKVHDDDENKADDLQFKIEKTHKCSEYKFKKQASFLQL